MKKMRTLVALPLVAMIFLFSSFTFKPAQHAGTAIVNYAWYTPAGQFVAWSTLVNAEFVSGEDTNPVGGTLALLGYTDGGPTVPPSGTLVYQLYSHP